MPGDDWANFESWWGSATNGLLRVTNWSLNQIGIKVPTGRPIDRLKNARRDRRETAELRSLLVRLERYKEQSADTRNAMCQRVCAHVLNEKTTAPQLLDAATTLLQKLLSNEGHFVIPEVNLNGQFALSEVWEFTKIARRQLALFENPRSAQRIEDILKGFLENLLVVQLLKKSTPEDETLIVPLHGIHPNIAGAIQAVGGVIGEKCTKEDGEPFPRLIEALYRNICLASGIDPDHPEPSHKQPVLPEQQTGMSPAQLVQAYFAQTPFADFFNTSVPYSLPAEARFEHTHIVGGSGHGKTQLLQSLILTDLEKLRAGKRSIVVVDSQGDLIRQILDLAVVGEMAERVVYINPNDIEYPPALNLFDFGLDRLEHYDLRQREVLVNGAIDLYEYIFGALLGAELTQKQGVIFRYIARLMMVVPNANIRTLMEFMEEPERTRPYLRKLDRTIAHFFETQFFDKRYNDTRGQILTRLFGVLSTSALDRMFTNERNKVNLFEAMNSGSLILIDTAKELLKQNGCEILGRFFIALICQAALERTPIDEQKRKDTLVYIDEAHDYFDESMENLLNQARKFKVGLVLAHQNLGQFDRKLHKTIMASTSIKMVGGLSGDDAAEFARNMNCDKEFLQSIRKYDDHTEFACNVRNHTPTAIRMDVPFGQMDRQPKISKEAYTALIELIRSRYCSPRNPPPDNLPPSDKPDEPELL